MSTQAKHTPGPWEISQNEAGELDICEEGAGDMLADLAKCKNAEANARLISAAPEMLDALRVTLHRAEQARHSSEQLGPIAAEWLDGIITEARQAIAKAEGRAGE